MSTDTVGAQHDAPNDPDTTAVILQEIIAVVGNPALTQEQIGNRLSHMYEAAEHANDEKAMTLINDTWQNVQELSNTATLAIGTAAAAKELARTIQGQRDQAIDELETLNSAIDSMDYDHPKVLGLIEAAEEDAYEWCMEVESQELYENLIDLVSTLEINLDNRTMTDDGRPASNYKIASRIQDIIRFSMIMNDVEKAALKAFILSMTEVKQ